MSQKRTVTWTRAKTTQLALVINVVSFGADALHASLSLRRNESAITDVTSLRRDIVDGFDSGDDGSSRGEAV